MEELEHCNEYCFLRGALIIVHKHGIWNLMLVIVPKKELAHLSDSESSKIHVWHLCVGHVYAQILNYIKTLSLLPIYESKGTLILIISIIDI